MRKLINLYILILLFVLSNTLFSSFIYAVQISGYVFQDDNSNLIFDKWEKGIKEVSVSNQKDIVRTDKQGYYKINIEKEDILFISKPINYKFPVNEKNLPQFYYIYNPDGSPHLEYKGLKPTGELPEKINFPLFKSEESDVFEAVIFADTQTYNSQQIQYMRDDTLAELIGTSASFGMILGDIVSDNLSMFDEINRNIAQLQIPFFNVPGNHDLNHDAKDNQYAYDTFKSHFGPNYYSFDYGKVHFIVLADIDWHGKTENAKQFYTGKVDDKQLGWIKNDLQYVEKDKLICLTMHIPPKTVISDGDADKITNRDKLFELFKDRKYVLMLAGHNHTAEQYFFEDKEGYKGIRPAHLVICGAVSGSWYGGPKDERGIPSSIQQDGTPNGYYIVKFMGNKYEISFKPSSLPKEYQINISSPDTKIKKEELKNIKITTNIFNASDRNIVKCSIDNSSPEQMTLSVMQDPYFLKIYNENKDKFQSWVYPLNSKHIWTLNIPDNLSPGLHCITISTVLDSGIQYSASKIVEVE